MYGFSVPSPSGTLSLVDHARQLVECYDELLRAHAHQFAYFRTCMYVSFPNARCTEAVSVATSGVT